MLVQNLRAPSATFVRKKIVKFIKLSATKNQHLLKEIYDRSSILIYKYLEDKWTYSYINQLQSFVQTINSGVNRVTKVAPNKVTKKDVPYLTSLIFNTSNIFPQNTLSSFKNYFNEEINLEGDWRVALSEIIFPAKINQVNKSDFEDIFF